MTSAQHKIPEHMVINPIDKAFRCTKIDTMPVEQIIRTYRKDFALDVRRYFRELDTIDIYRCDQTGYRFYHPFWLAGDEAFYKELSDKRKSYYHERWEHRISIGYARPGEKWLEIGSGNSSFLQALADAGVRAKGLELNSAQAATATTAAFEVEGIDFFSLRRGESLYDTVCLFQVLEHMHDVSGFFTHVRHFIKPGGKLIISVPNNNPFLYVNDKFNTLNLPPHHMGLWTGPALEAVARHFGFNTIELQFQKLSPLEFDYVLNLVSFRNLRPRNLQFFALRILRRLLPKPVFQRISQFYRSSVVNGRNLVIILEKNR